MVGGYIFAGLVIIGIAALIVYKIKWGRSDRAEARGRKDRIEEERVEEAGRAETRRKKEETNEERNKK